MIASSSLNIMRVKWPKFMLYVSQAPTQIAIPITASTRKCGRPDVSVAQVELHAMIVMQTAREMHQ
jgi:hypothetical protein